MSFRKGTFFAPRRGEYSSYGEHEYGVFLKAFNPVTKIEGKDVTGHHLDIPIDALMMDMRGDGIIREIATFLPNQVKSATANSGAFTESKSTLHAGGFQMLLDLGLDPAPNITTVTGQQSELPLWAQTATQVGKTDTILPNTENNQKETPSFQRETVEAENQKETSKSDLFHDNIKLAEYIASKFWAPDEQRDDIRQKAKIALARAAAYRFASRPALLPVATGRCRRRKLGRVPPPLPRSARRGDRD